MQSLANTYNEIFASLSPQEILQLIIQKHPDKIAFSTSQRAEDQVITAMLMEIDKNARIFTLNTGRLFAETYELNVAEYDTANNILKINPLLHWSEAMVWDYIHQNNVPFHALHSKGLSSIGCQPCTRAIEPSEDIRSGRWWWENPDSKECGLHR